MSSEYSDCRTRRCTAFDPSNKQHPRLLITPSEREQVTRKGRMRVAFSMYQYRQQIELLIPHLGAHFVGRFGHSDTGTSEGCAGQLFR